MVGNIFNAQQGHVPVVTFIPLFSPPPLPLVTEPMAGITAARAPYTGPIVIKKITWYYKGDAALIDYGVKTTQFGRTVTQWYYNQRYENFEGVYIASKYASMIESDRTPSFIRITPSQACTGKIEMWGGKYRVHSD